MRIDEVLRLTVLGGGALTVGLVIGLYGSHYALDLAKIASGITGFSVLLWLIEKGRAGAGRAVAALGKLRLREPKEEEED